MTLGDALVIVGCLLLIALGAWGGYSWRADEVAQLQREAADQRLRADYQTEVLAEVEQLAADARAAAAEQQAATEATLAARGDRIAQLLADASARQATTREKAAADEDCAPLRDLPVCAAVADRLYGGPVTAGPH